MFVVQRRGIKLSKGFYAAVIVLLLLAGAFGAVLTLHVHYNPKTGD